MSDTDQAVEAAERLDYLDQPDTRGHHDVGWQVTERFASTSSLSLQPL